LEATTQKSRNGGELQPWRKLAAIVPIYWEGNRMEVLEVILSTGRGSLGICEIRIALEGALKSEH
jgi:hypothetical protein